ncbi:RagB/SusD family nutrient uptake outer membrane protein [Natronoflexus pectinivorans]|uniref:Putative outer membrane starch-binding protein n=1 Tax=Natronoflexus pectinivorans TaxID=682526 RepID=A0A4R2GJE1_9BACT|nr:RagB/SusD family nutrient uptake outer membrane protein [Natronoflexus pectinivorans]TCO08849.1 putative outer membrane starch-binding protein [Natronoflexus pectinivorans]
MKQLHYIIIVLIAVANSCADSFLDTKELTRQVDENYYSTPEECETALVGCYAALQLIWSDGIALPNAATVKGDLAFGGTGSADDRDYKKIDEHDVNIAPSFVDMFNPNWVNYYRGIFRCNKLIERIDQPDWGDNLATRNRILAEAKFLRAFFYFDMVRMFENIPLLLRESRENLPQADPDDVYRAITEDLLYAVEHARSTTHGAMPSTDHGRVTSWAAKSLLARVYLYYTGYYNQPDLVDLVNGDQVLAYLEDVIENSGHGLVEDFFSLWPAAANYKAVRDGGTLVDANYAGETNQEVVFAIKYTYTSNYDGDVDGNHWMVMNGLRLQTYSRLGYASGWGASTVVPEFYQNWDPNDDRREASVMAIQEEGIAYNYIDDVREYTGYFTKKYVPFTDENGVPMTEVYEAANHMIGQFQDYFSIRFSDVLLMAAELGSSNALEYVNMVRRRAGVDEISAVTREQIFEERKYEFAFEGLRYWDLLRYDHTLQFAASKLNYSGEVLDGGVPYTKTINGNNILTTRGLFQIPQTQITRSNNVLRQNPGWE